jgi:hypothetical protein
VTKNQIMKLAVLATSTWSLPCLPICFANSMGVPQAQEASHNPIVRRVGTIKAINGTVIILALDSGPDVNVVVPTPARIMRIAPGETDLKNATLIQLHDLQVGDRIRVVGNSSEDVKSIAASSIVALKRSDLEARHQQELRDWQKRGLDGMVKSVDPATGTVVVSVPHLEGAQEVAVHTSASTVIRRYPPDSAEFAAAKPSTFQEIGPGDQFHARGDRIADGSSFAAEEVVAGRFRNVEGTISSVDASAGTISVHDLLSKKSVQMRVNADSQLRRLPAEVARFAIGWKREAVRPGPSRDVPDHGSEAGGETPPERQRAGTAGSIRSGRPDLNQMLSRMPALALGDLHKGDAVMVVATEGIPPSDGTVTKLLSGVEPILQAAPSAGQTLMLTPWNLGGSSSGDASNQ